MRDEAKDDYKELGIYNDLNSSVQDLDHSHLMDMQKPAVRAAFIDSRASNNMEYVSDRAAFIEQSAEKFYPLNSMLSTLHEYEATINSDM